LQLLDAAVTAFAERGFHGTTTRHIAAAAGMSPAAVYVHHKSKEELLYVIADLGHRGVLELVRTAIAAESEPAAQLTGVMRALAEDHARNHERARVINNELAALSSQHRQAIRRIRRTISSEIRSLVERGVAAGAFDTPDSAMAATALLSLNLDIGRWYREDRAWSSEDVGRFYADLGLRIVGASPR
jgi:AcrR family transcriptional regulator